MNNFVVLCLSSVTITGENLLGYGQNISSVLFGNVPAIINYSTLNDSSIEVRVQANNNINTEAVTITIISDTFAIVRSTAPIWTFLVPGEITINSPLEGQVGTRILITGMNLLGGGTDIAEAFVDGVPATASSVSDTSITLIPGNLRDRMDNFYPGQIFLESDTGSIVIGGTYTHRESGSISTFSPSRGRGGTRVSITGTNLLGFGSSFSRIQLAGVTVRRVEFANATNIVVEADFSSGASNGPVVLTTDTGAVITSSSNFTYDEPGVSIVSPLSGAEGTGVSLSGSGLLPSNVQLVSITVGGISVSRIVTASNAEISVILGPAPSSNPSRAEIVITATDGSFVNGIFFSFMNFVLALPNANLGREGTLVHVLLPNASQFDTNLNLRVTVDDQPASIVAVDVSQRTVMVRVPRARSHGAYTADVAVEGLNGLVARLRGAFTYISGGLICDIEPEEGQMGTRITLRGENFLGGSRALSSVEVVGQQAAVTSFSNTSAVIQLPQIDSSLIFPLTGDIVMTADTGAILRRLNAFTLTVPGRITSASPSRGQNGTTVTIEGTRLLQGTLEVSTVTLAGVPATVIGRPSSTIVTVQAGLSTIPSGSLQDVVITLSTGATIRYIEGFEYITPGIITNVTPATGTVGTRISIQGTNLLQGGTNALQVLLKGIPADVIMSSDTTIMIVAQSDTAGIGDIVIVSDTGATLTGVGRWRYLDLGAILDVSPEVSQQGATISITGISLLGSAMSIVECRLAGVVGTIVSTPTDTSVLCVAGNVPFSRVEMTGFIQLVTNTGVMLDSSEDNVTFTYYPSVIDSVSPSQGNNGTVVRIAGLNLFGSPDSFPSPFTVLLGSIMTRIVSSDPNEIIVIAGLSTPSVGNTVRIESASGTFLELPGAWNYTEPGRITSVSPQLGFPGTEVELFGENLFIPEEAPYRIIAGQTVGFDVSIVDDTTATFRAGLYEGSDSPEEELPIQVISATGRTVFDTNVTFYYNQIRATLSSINPVAGSEGSLVEITGENLPNASDIIRITLAGVSATVVSINEDMIVVRAGRPPSTGVSGPVIMETSEFILSVVRSVWNYFPILTSTSVSPISGQNGTEVNIDLDTIVPYPPIGRVELNGVNAEIVGVNNTLLTVYAGPSQSAIAGSLGNITLFLFSGITITIFDSWTYQQPVSIAQVSPSSGYFGTLVNITGNMFQADSATLRVSEVYLSGMNTDIVSQTNTFLQVRISDEQINSIQNVVGPIVIIAEDGATYTSPSSLTFTYLRVNILEVSPSSGIRGTQVSLRGENLLAGGSIITLFTVAGIAATVLDSNSTLINFEAGPSPTRTSQSDIRYTMDTGAVVTIQNSWAYVDEGQVTFVTPSSGELGTVVSITGSGLFGGGTRAEAVLLNSIMATEIISNFDSFIQVRAQAGTGSLSPGSVMIVSDTGAVIESPREIQFTYLQPARFMSIEPADGQNGTIVNVTGTGFHNGEGIARVFLAGTEAAIIAIEESSIIVEAGRPSNLESIAGPVVIQSVFNTTSISSQPFRYLQEGVILSVAPDRGRNNTISLITGENLYGGGSMLLNVTLDGVVASIINQSSSRVFVRAGLPSTVSGTTGNIILISNTNSYVTRIDGWTNVPQGTIDSISPPSGQFGTRIIIRGQNLLSGGSSLNSLLMDDIELFDISTVSNTIIRARVGQPEFGYEVTTESVTLVSNFNSELYLEYTWDFLNQSNITELYPPSGFSITAVNITGTNLLGGGSRITTATVSGIPARVVSSTNTFVMIVTGENGGGMEIQGMVVLEADTGALSMAEWRYERECPNNTFGMVDNCTACDRECASCIGPSSFDCTSCTNFAILTNASNTGMVCVSSCPGLSTLDNVCVDRCASNQFEQINTELNLTFCLDCSDLCDPNLGCDGPASTECTGCRFFLDVITQNCTAACPADRYYVNETKECRPCDDQCSGGCTGPTERDCNSCRDFTTFISATLASGFSNTECTSSCPELYFEDARHCISCDPNCRDECSDATPFSCGKCNWLSFKYPNGTKCVADCGPSYYPDQSNECQPCSELCLSNSSCSGPNPQDCDTCSLSYNSDCVRECSDTHYANSLTRLCEECDPSCTIGCVNSSKNCINEQGPFIAGDGTIGIVVVIIIVLVVIIVLLVMLVVWFLKTGGRKFSSFKLPSSFTHTDSSSNIDTVRYSQRTQVQDINSGPSRDIPLRSIETDKHVQNPLYDDEVEDDIDNKDWTLRKKKAEFVKTKGEEVSLPEKNQPISASQDVYVEVETQEVQESTMDDEKKTLLARESSLPEKNQPVSASQDLYMDMDASEQSKRASVVLENPAAGSPYIKMSSAPVKRQSLTENQDSIQTEEKSYPYSKIKKEASLPEKNQLISGSQDLYTEMEAPQAYPVIEEMSASQDVYTDMEMGPPSIPTRDIPVVPVIPPKPTLKPPIAVPPREATISEQPSEKPPIPQKAEKPPPPGPPSEPGEMYTAMDAGITEVFMNPIAEDTYDDVASSPPGTSPPASSSPVPVEDSGLYEDTESSDFLENYRKSKRDMKLPPVPESRNDKKKRQSAPALPSGPIPKKKTSIPLPITPLQKSLSVSSMPSKPTSPTSPDSRPMSVVSLPEEESLYDDIPGAGMSEQLVPPTPSRNPPAKSKPTKKQQPKGKQMKK